MMQTTIILCFEVFILAFGSSPPGKGGNRIAYSNCTEVCVCTRAHSQYIIVGFHVQNPSACQIWAKPLSDMTYAVAFYNAVSHGYPTVVLCHTMQI